MTPINECKTPTDQEGSHLKALKEGITHKQHHQRFFHFDLDQPSSASGNSANRSVVKKEKNLNSPNLSPIRLQQETSGTALHAPINVTTTNKKKLIHSSSKETTARAG
jgi:hypothetical protein